MVKEFSCLKFRVASPKPIALWLCIVMTKLSKMVAPFTLQTSERKLTKIIGGLVIYVLSLHGEDNSKFNLKFKTFMRVFIISHSMFGAVLPLEVYLLSISLYSNIAFL